MSFRPLVAIVLALTAVSSQASLSIPTATISYGAYSITYETDSTFSAPNFNFSGDSGNVGFGWTVPTSFSAGGSIDTQNYGLPSFTLTTNEGWSLSGLKGSLGNFSYIETGNANTSAQVSGSLSLNGLPSSPTVTAFLTKTPYSTPGYRSGYFAANGTIYSGTFASIGISGAQLTLTTDGGGFGAITVVPGQKLEFSLIATPVPEPESYAMMLVGLLAVGTIVRRRQKG